jgi:hypothetical protein
MARDSQTERPEADVSEQMTMPRRRPVGNLPLEALAALSQSHVGLAEGDIFWIPEAYLEYHSGKDGRFCVLAALEALSGEDVPTVGPRPHHTGGRPG